MFLRIVDALGNHDEYFQTRFDVADIMSLSPLQKCTITICVLAYKSPASNVDYYVQIGETTARECLETFVRGVNQIFGVEYLRRPSNNDTQYLLQIGEACDFSCMLGSIDCMY